MSGTTAKKSVPSLASILDKDKNKDKDIEPVTPTEPDDNDIVDDEPVVEKDEPKLSEHVVATVPNKTPDELSAESADETADRYNINSEISKTDAENPRVQAYNETRTYQVPSGTHLHPDIAKSQQNRGIAETHTDNAMVKHQDTAPTYDFAPDAEVNDKWPGHPKTND